MAFLRAKATNAAQNFHNAVATSANLDNVTSKLSLGSITNAVSGLMGGEDLSLKNRYSSSAPVREDNNVKFHVDGCAYFWAVSEALEQAKESIWILGCKLNRSPILVYRHKT